MRSHLHQQVNRKVSDFIVGEAGKVGSRSALTAATFIGATSLAGILLGAPDAAAEGNCGPNTQCNEGEICCHWYDEVANQGYENCEQDSYNCKGPMEEIGPGISCWAL